MVLDLKPKPENRFVKEVRFEEVKRGTFKHNLDRLYHLMSTEPEKYVGYVLRKKDELLATLWRGGTKVITLANHDIYYHEAGQIIDEIKKFLEEHK